MRSGILRPTAPRRRRGTDYCFHHRRDLKRTRSSATIQQSDGAGAGGRIGRAALAPPADPTATRAGANLPFATQGMAAERPGLTATPSARLPTWLPLSRQRQPGGSSCYGIVCCC